MKWWNFPPCSRVSTSSALETLYARATQTRQTGDPDVRNKDRACMKALLGRRIMARSLAIAGAAFAAVGLSGPAALADEGLWTFDNFPAAAVKATYGVAIDQAWLDRVQHAAVRLSTGCSASVVSPEGLVLTNHHCISDCAQSVSTPQQDYIESGFIAANRREERLCPGMQAEILTSIADVTDRIEGAVAGKTGPDFVKSRDATIAAIEQEGCAC